MKRFLLLSLLLLLLLPSSGNAQVAAKDEIYVFDNFSGGLVSKLNPFALDKTQAETAENVRFSDQVLSLSKRDELILYGTADADEEITGMHRLYLKDGTKVLLVNHGDEIEKGNDSTGAFTSILTVSSGDRRWMWLTWQNVAIGCDGYNQCVKYDGSSASATYLGSALATDAGSGAGPNGTYTYKVTCYTSSYEVSMNVASNSVTVSDNDINLTMIPICPDSFLGETITGRKIYRIENAGSTYKLLSNGTIANNTATTLTDSDADGALGAALSPTYTYTIPKGRFPNIHKNRLWLANDPSNPSRIYYSEDASPDFFLTDAYFNVRRDDGDEITCNRNLLGKLVVCKNNSIQYIHTDKDDPDDWAISDPFSFFGPQAPYSVVNSPIGIIYLANNGLYRFNGQASELISDSVTPEIRDIQPSNYGNVWSAFHRNRYYMTYTSFASGASSNNRVLILDLLANQTGAYSKDLMNVNVFAVFGAGTDVEALYSGASDSGKVYAHNETVKELVHKTHADFAGTFDDMRYIPVRSGGNADSPVLELAWTQTINEMAGTIDAATGIIDRPDTDGWYISQFLTLNAGTFDKLYWNESIPASGGEVTFDIRSGATSNDTNVAAWSTGYTNPAGSDISGATANTIVQYRINMSTDNINFTPNVYRLNNYVVRLTYNTVGAVAETTVPLRWRSGYLDFGAPGYKKSLKKIYVYYDYPAGEEGTLNLTFENLEGDTDTFAIDLFDNPDQYVEYFTNGEFIGEFIRLTVQETSLNPITIKKLTVIYDLEPLI